ncbi:MAG: hypothetical protein FE044_02420 [Thermoplasmata archaeon]|nr:MAG: hypothetical protein FE044_02420 [Thermoplasmata archaeon]
MMDKNEVVIIPSLTLLIVGIENKKELADVLINGIKNMTAFVAVNSAMFKDINKILEENADDVFEFIKKWREVYINVINFKGKFAFKEWLFKFPIHLFHKTKKEVAERTSKLIKEKREAQHKHLY